jgi:O-acetyl-ADP-ribose deacetylase (regulator of RNase III)
VIHTPGPRWRGGDHNEAELLRSCYRSCLRIAAEQGCETVDFPSISTGIYAFPLEQAARIAVSEIAACLRDYPVLRRVRMVCFDSRTMRAYEDSLRSLEA